jgi:hypothetical protein
VPTKPKAPAPLSQEEVIAESWRVLSDLVTAGEATLHSGKVLKLEGKDLANVIRAVSRLKKPKERQTANLDALRVARTSRPTPPPAAT